MTSSVSATEYQLFDNLGRMTQMAQITDGKAYTSKYAYNFSGALVEEEYPSGRRVKNEFESDGDISRIYGKATPSATERTYANAFSYMPDGRIEKLRLGNGLWERAQFNSRLQVTELAVGHGVNNGNLWKLGYEYGEIDTNGNVDTAKNTGNVARQTLNFTGLTHPFVQTYKYDSLYRLSEARETSNGAQTWKQGFTYDRYGNRLTHAKFSGANQITHTAVTHPTIDPNTNRFMSGQGYLFDKNGNLTTDAENRSFVFNGDNKQKEIRDASNNLVGEYFYDGEGKRIKKKAYVSGVLDEETTFIYSSGKLIAEYSTKPPAPNPTTSWTVTDQLGSPRVLVNTMGQVVSRRDFLPFGEEISPIEPANLRSNTSLKYNVDGVRQKFTGYQKDDESGLDFAEARMYENRHGRFTAVDPLLASGKSGNPQTFNRYVYVMNSPLIMTDPDGLQAGWWAYRDYDEDGQPKRAFAFFTSQSQQEMTEAMRGRYETWRGNRYYIYGDGRNAVSLPENGNGMNFSTERISQEKMQSIVSTQQGGGPFSDEQIATLQQAQVDVVMKTPEMELRKAASGMAGSFLAGGLTFCSNYALRNVAFGTNPGEAVFFSGRGAASVANQFATENGLKTITMTPGGSAINTVTSASVFGRPAYQVFPNASTRLWSWGSRYFAEGASGTVRFFPGQAVSPTSIFITRELPILQRNALVTGIQVCRPTDAPRFFTN